MPRSHSNLVASGIYLFHTNPKFMSTMMHTVFETSCPSSTTTSNSNRLLSHQATLAADLRLQESLPTGSSHCGLPAAWVTNHTVPRNDGNAQNSCEAAEEKRHDAARRETIGQRRGWRRFAGKVEQARRVAGGVARGGDRRRVCCAGGEVVVGDGEGFLQVQRRLDDCGCEARGDVPLEMAVEEPDACWKAVLVCLDVCSSSCD